ncbi:flagellar basal-body MS-ring/collar protein FliF [Sphingomonas bacterium]|uniref:flagellar basal-body MS-ring/collar protein FliF n=1 Tax=Sphingomonas bacterium TaxID=1895847 RepID=UPI00262B740D|nr:flagellar basal-body MS-ring/collar protein FliF [Sphingomonas bacterium]MDB5677889.1 fliF [Sphingomonas bacterium]
MTTALTPLPDTGNQGFANPLSQMRVMLAQPAVKRSLPMIFMVGLIASAALAWFMLSTPTQKTLFSNLPDSDKSAVISALKTGGITGRLDESTDSVTVSESDYSKARMLLAGQGLPKSAPAGYAILDNLPMGTSRAVEGERLRQARETELARSIEDIDAVAEARVHLAVPENTVFVRDNAAPTASVILKLQGGRSLSDAQVASIVNLVASSVPGMKPEGVTIVDQAGSLLSKPSGGDGGNDERVRFQNQVEQKYRDKLTTLLTPLVGAGNFTAEVSAEVNLDDTSSTRESYDKAGALRAEQGNWTGKDGSTGAPGGIPGALSNTPPGPTTVTAPTAQPTPAAAGAAPAAAPAVPDTAKSADSYARAYDLGKEVSVTRAAPGSVKRLSVSVALSDPATGKPRSPVEIQQITDLVRSAVGADPARNDQVTVVSRRFAPAAVTGGGQAFYESGWFAMIIRNATALVIALLVLFLGVRPLATALLKKRDDVGRGGRDLAALGIGVPAAGARGVKGPVGIDALESAQNFDDRIGTVRGFTRDNPARAALAVRDMIKADAR